MKGQRGKLHRPRIGAFTAIPFVLFLAASCAPPFDRGGSDVTIEVSQPAFVSGYVKDHSSGAPIPGAVISADDRTYETKSDLTGRFVLELPPGMHRLTTEHESHETRTDELTVFDSERADVEIHMGADGEAADGLLVTARSRISERPLVDDFEIEGGVIERERIDRLLETNREIADLLRAATDALIIEDQQVLDAITGVSVPGYCIELSTEAETDGCASVVVAHNDAVQAYPDRFLKDIDPATIERVEILNPSEAVFRFGLEAGNGALVIFTR